MVDVNSWKLWLSVILAAAAVGSLAMGGLRRVFAVYDAPDQVADCLAKTASLEDDMETARIRICEMHGLFTSQCPAFDLHTEDDE